MYAVHMCPVHVRCVNTALYFIHVIHVCGGGAGLFVFLLYTLLIGRVSYLIYVSMRHYVLTTSGDIVVCFHTAVCLNC